MLAEVSLEEQHLRILKDENARLKDELDRVSSIAGKFLGRPISSLPSPLPYSPLDLAVGRSSGGGVFAGMSNVAPTIPAVPGFLMEDSSMLVFDRALMAMDELVKMARMEEPLWVPIPDGSGKEILNYEEYLGMFPRCLSLRQVGFLSEISRESGMINFDSLSLVETFPTMIARVSTTDILSSRMEGTSGNTFQIMYAEMQLLSPLVPIRQVNFLRFCKQHGDGVWAVVDVSVHDIHDCLQALKVQGTNMVIRRLPSSCLVQDLPNGYSKVDSLALSLSVH